MDDEKFYQIVADELRTNAINEALWTKAIAKSLGDENKTKAMYIQLRVEQLMQAERASQAGEASGNRPQSTPRHSDQVAQWIVTAVLLIIIFVVVRKWVWPKVEHYF